MVALGVWRDWKSGRSASEDNVIRNNKRTSKKNCPKAPRAMIVRKHEFIVALVRPYLKIYFPVFLGNPGAEK